MLYIWTLFRIFVYKFKIMNYTEAEHILLIDYLESLLQGQKDYLDVLYHTYKDYAGCVKLQGAIELLEKRIKFHKKQLADGYYNY